MPDHQGKYDGLCGMYAITNAYRICCCGTFDDEDEDLRKIFKTACGALAEDEWPHTLWDGADFDDMRTMIAKCQKRMRRKFRKIGVPH